MWSDLPHLDPACLLIQPGSPKTNKASRQCSQQLMEKTTNQNDNLPFSRGQEKCSGLSLNCLRSVLIPEPTTRPTGWVVLIGQAWVSYPGTRKQGRGGSSEENQKNGIDPSRQNNRCTSLLTGLHTP